QPRSPIRSTDRQLTEQASAPARLPVASRRRLARWPHLGLLRQPRGQPLGRHRHLVAQLEVVAQPAAIERAVRDRRLYCATGLALVAAIAEAALRGQRLDFAEAAVGQAFLAGGLEFAHARRVDQAGAR